MSSSPPFSWQDLARPSTDKPKVPDSSDSDRRTRRSTKTRNDADSTRTQTRRGDTEADPTELLRERLARTHMMSGGLGDCDNEPRRSSHRDPSSSRHRPRHHTEEPSLSSRRGGESIRQDRDRHADEPRRPSRRDRDDGRERYTYVPSEAPRLGTQYSSSRRDRDRESDHDLSEYRAEPAAPVHRSSRNSERERERDHRRSDHSSRGMMTEDMHRFRDVAGERARQGREANRASGRTHAHLDPFGAFSEPRGPYYY